MTARQRQVHRLEKQIAHAFKALIRALNAYEREHIALADSVNFIDRLMPQSEIKEREHWTYADTKRLKEIRVLSAHRTKVWCADVKKNLLRQQRNAGGMSATR